MQAGLTVLFLIGMYTRSSIAESGLGSDCYPGFFVWGWKFNHASYSGVYGWCSENGNEACYVHAHRQLHGQPNPSKLYKLCRKKGDIAIGNR